jgi:hypothetical protein
VINITITNLKLTCGACPTLWEGRTDQDGYVTIRYRHGYLSVRFNGYAPPSMDDEIWGSHVDLASDGVMSYEELRGALPSKIGLPDAEENSEGHWD